MAGFFVQSLADRIFDKGRSLGKNILRVRSGKGYIHSLSLRMRRIISCTQFIPIRKRLTVTRLKSILIRIRITVTGLESMPDRIRMTPARPKYICRQVRTTINCIKYILRKVRIPFDSLETMQIEAVLTINIVKSGSLNIF